MLTAGRSLVRAAKSGRSLPRWDAFHDLYERGLDPRHGQIIMVAGRSGSQKSALALAWTINMRLPTLYLSGDMSPETAANRVAASITGETREQIEEGMKNPEKRREYMERLAEVPITFSFGAPITWHKLGDEIDAYVELWGAYPEVIVVDNLKEVEGAGHEYQGQMDAMDGLTDLARETGSTVLVMAHASDKSWDASHQPFRPPSRDEVKNGLSENPEVSLSVAFDPNRKEFHVAIIKQRDGWSDPTARYFDTLRADPVRTRFYRLREGGLG